MKLRVKPQVPVANDSAFSNIVPLKMSIVVGVFQCFGAIPQFIITCLYFTGDGKSFLISEGADFLLYIAVYVLLSANYGVNFFIYSVTCRGFRQCCFSLLTSSQIAQKASVTCKPTCCMCVKNEQRRN